ncbi:MAG: protein tonB [Lysobacteraceae bacterium]|nr:MAG: protein tonB [Xanthomonadaceae bacterium]
MRNPMGMRNQYTADGVDAWGRGPMRALFLSLWLLLALPALAGHDVSAMRKQAEFSMLVEGEVVIDPDGKVRSHTLDPAAHLTDDLTGFIDKAVAQWRFHPVKVDGNVVRARVPMSLRLVISRADDESYTLRIASTYFGASDAEASAGKTDGDAALPRAQRLKPPLYPREALRLGAKGTVYLIVQMGLDGKVVAVDAEQVNLRVVGTSQQMTSMRKLLADAAMRAARGWTFAPPARGTEGDRDGWLVRVPVTYMLVGDKKPRPGEWEAYIPGPRNLDIPFAREQLRVAGNPDALPGDGAYSLEQGARLLGPPAT